jgi:hypothetical protein
MIELPDFATCTALLFTLPLLYWLVFDNDRKY